MFVPIKVILKGVIFMQPNTKMAILQRPEIFLKNNGER